MSCSSDDEDSSSTSSSSSCSSNCMAVQPLQENPQLLYKEVRKCKNLHWNHLKFVSLEEKLFQKTNSSLTMINLDHNYLTHLPESFCMMKSLTTIYLGHNKLQNLPDNLGDLENLILLDVAGNNIRCLPNSFNKLKKLKSLYITNNGLKELPLGMSKLKNLTYLQLSNNKLRQLTDEIGHLESLQYLLVDGNLIKTVPNSIIHLQNLIHASFQYNRLIYLPSLFSTNIVFLFEHNPEINYLNFSFYMKLLPTRCSANDVIPLLPWANMFTKIIAIQNNELWITTGTHRENCLKLPRHLKSLSLTPLLSKNRISPLYEICFRLIGKLIYKNAESYYKYNLPFDNVPFFINIILREGPIQKCLSQKCENFIYTSSSVFIIKVLLECLDWDEDKNVPLVLYFCNDFCAVEFYTAIISRNYKFGGSEAIRRGLLNPYNVKIA